MTSVGHLKRIQFVLDRNDKVERKIRNILFMDLSKLARDPHKSRTEMLFSMQKESALHFVDDIRSHVHKQF
jgi:hypothetical protein